MNQKVNSYLAFGVVLVLAFGLGSFALTEKGNFPTTEQTALVVRKSQNKTQKNENGIYRQISFGDGKTKVFLQIPEKWLVETRHSGESDLTVEEMRNFLATDYEGDIKNNLSLSSDYGDMTWNNLHSLQADEVEKIYDRKNDDGSSFFPNASLSAEKAIWYTDWNGEQIDFYLKNQGQSQAVLLEKQEIEKNTDKWNVPEFGFSGWEKGMVGGKKADILVFPIAKDANGKEYSRKDATGGEKYFVELSGQKTLVIVKQAKGSSIFEEEFDKLIKSVRFE